MILNPHADAPGRGSAECVPAWQAIESRQRLAASRWWLVAQPDHAALAGDLARGMDSSLIPALDGDVIRAISLHDEGWREFDSDGPRVENRRPLSFLEIPPPDFLQAWRASIERAEEVAAVGGILVSEHFCRLGRAALERDLQTGDRELVERFLEEEHHRQDLLRSCQARTPEEISALVNLLQFCDLLSLYLCSGARDTIVFPQQFRGTQIRLGFTGELCRTDPPLFGDGLSLAVRARRYPKGADDCDASLPFLLA